MWKCSKKKFIYFLLVVSILLSGMCYEEVQADFILMEEMQTDRSAGDNYTMFESPLPGFGKIFSENPQDKGNVSKVEIPEGKIFSPEARTEEIVTRSAAIDSVKSMGKIRQRTGTASLYCSCSRDKIEKFFYDICLERTPDTYSSRVIVEYIHEKDGKKAFVHMLG